MAALRFLFGFHGKVARRPFWIFGPTLYALCTLASSYEDAARGTLLQMPWMPGAIVLYLYMFAGMWAFSVAVLVMAIDLFLAQKTVAGQWLFLTAFAACLALCWMVLAVASKRRHDRGKSSWWRLILFIVAPTSLDFAAGEAASAGRGARLIFIGFFLHLWSFVELGCFPGVAGANSYGPDPRAVANAAAT